MEAFVYCEDCEFDVVAVWHSPERFSAEWMDDPAPHMACPYCDRCLALIDWDDPAYFTPVAA